jgi:argininosuccinate lyase
VGDGHLWSGRFASRPADSLMAFTASIGFDRRLARYDLAGSRAHVAGLRHVGLLAEAEAETLLGALDAVEAELVSGSFLFQESDEDIHTAVERRVTELAGDVGAKLHTGRSRNDQVACDLRLYCAGELSSVAQGLVELVRVLMDRAVAAGETYLPGYTHLQRAQPVLLAHHLLAHATALVRDLDRVRVTIDRLSVSPLGAGAGAGSSLALDPEFVAGQLGFGAAFANSMDAVSDRDFVAESLFDAALIGVHLSRLGEEMVIWSSQEFGFVRLADAYSTGSSMLPNKKNPDIAELARGKSGRLIGHLAGFLATLKGLPLTYNRDLQEDKEPLFDALDQVRLGLAAMTGMIATVEFMADRMAEAAADPNMGAIDLAEWLVESGWPFRRAHHLVASLVRTSLDGGADLASLVREHPDLGSEALAVLGPMRSILRRQSPGGAGVESVRAQLARLEAQLAEIEAALAAK